LSSIPLVPLEALAFGAIAGFVGTFVLSVLARIVPGMQNLTHKESEAARRQHEPRDRFDAEAVRAWQDRARSPGANERRARRPPVFTAEGALVTAEGPGPEGAAAEFAVKLVTGLFGRDITWSARRAGKIVHFVYGTLWGAAYGLVAGSFRLPWALAGAGFGFLVWGVGPGWLAPMMKVLLAPRTLRPLSNALLIGAHVLYGLIAAFIFARFAWSAS
jgi:hypothetical protein